MIELELESLYRSLYRVRVEVRSLYRVRVRVRAPIACREKDLSSVVPVRLSGRSNGSECPPEMFGARWRNGRSTLVPNEAAGRKWESGRNFANSLALTAVLDL